MVQKYSDLLSTLYDEVGPVGTLGRGSHYSVLRAVVWNPAPQFHDFAVVWDEDHDTRVIWVIEQLYVKQLLSSVVAVGERKGGITVLTRTQQRPEFATQVSSIAEGVPSDCFSSEVELFAEATGMIINDSIARVRAYLAGIDALWQLGAKPLSFATEPFDPSLAIPNRDQSR
jgi:hypothetical protein